MDALILGNGINALSLLRQLNAEDYSAKIFALAPGPATWSRFPVETKVLNATASDEQIVHEILNLNCSTAKPLIIPTSDFDVELIASNAASLEDRYDIPNRLSVLRGILRKDRQYEACQRLGIPCPRFILVRDKVSYFEKRNVILLMELPIIIKPNKRTANDFAQSNFRLRVFREIFELQSEIDILAENLNYDFNVAEVVPGEPDQIWATTAYLDESSSMLQSWTGRKLTQRPYYFGVFASAEGRQNEIVESQAKTLLEDFKHCGIGEPEFKFDFRSKTYKLMEINPRPMMWNYLGFVSGINLPALFVADRQKDFVKRARLLNNKQIDGRKLVFMHNELMNLFENPFKSKRWTNVARALLHPNKSFAVFSFSDLGPFFFFIREMIRRILKI